MSAMEMICVWQEHEAGKSTAAGTGRVPGADRALADVSSGGERRVKTLRRRPWAERVIASTARNSSRGKHPAVRLGRSRHRLAQQSRTGADRGSCVWRLVRVTRV